MKFSPSVLSFARQHNLSPDDVETLRFRVEVAAKAQELEHNTGESDTAILAVTQVEYLANKLGFEVIWAGLYPLLRKEGFDYDVPGC